MTQPRPIMRMRNRIDGTEIRCIGAIPSVIFTQEAMCDMEILIALAPQEIGWLGTVHRTSGTLYTVSRVYLPEQWVGPAHTTLDKRGMSKIHAQIVAEEGEEATDHVLFWGHSHANMDVTPSLIDDATMMKLGRGAPWFVRGVFNKRGDVQVDVFLFEGIDVAYLNVPWRVASPIDTQRVDHWQELLTERVKEPKPRPEAPSARRGRTTTLAPEHLRQFFRELPTELDAPSDPSTSPGPGDKEEWK